MRIDGHVSRSSREGLSFTVRNVNLGLRVTIVLGHAEVYKKEGKSLRQYLELF